MNSKSMNPPCLGMSSSSGRGSRRRMRGPSFRSTIMASVVLFGSYLVLEQPNSYSHFSLARQLIPQRMNLASAERRSCGADETIRRRGHSHNDYWQDYPLSSAIAHGLTSVEVDVFPRGDKLLVGHTRFDLESHRTIENMYINPILAMIKGRRTSSSSNLPDRGSLPIARGGSQRKVLGRRRGFFSSQRNALSGRDSLTLLVDLKADPEESVSLLHNILAPLRPYLTAVDKRGNIKHGMLTVLLSGNRPSFSSLHAPAQGTPRARERYLFIDGRAKDISQNSDSAVVPMVSLSWRSMQLARMFGRGERYMKRMTERAHAQGKRLRIWGAPNAEGAWRKIMRSNVDLLSVDDHERFARFASRFHFM